MVPPFLTALNVSYAVVFSQLSGTRCLVHKLNLTVFNRGSLWEYLRLDSGRYSRILIAAKLKFHFSQTNSGLSDFFQT